MQIAYFSSISDNTKRFVDKLGLPAFRIPITSGDILVMSEPYVLITPTYGAGRGDAVPKQVIKFLNEPSNRDLLVAVVAGGNRNFGPKFGIAGDVIAQKCNVPLLHKFEIIGNPEDVTYVTEEIERIYNDLA
jgi:protein involved in ribonucleotide reduction